MKVVTVFGTRPEIIRLSQVIKQIDNFCDHTLVHTGQNYDPNLSDVFFEELGVRRPDIHMGIQLASFAEQIGQIMIQSEQVLSNIKPDRLLILGDTNSGLAAVIAARMGIPVFHMEAGNRCYDDRVPEEINRRIIDHSSNVLMPYTYRSKENLIREGIERQRIFVTGNPIFEVLEFYKEQIESSNVLDKLQLAANAYFLITMHRAENVDLSARLVSLLSGLTQIGQEYQQPIIVSLHPRTADKIKRFNIDIDPTYLKMMTPMGFFDFVKLETNARCVISDSGTVQEECSIFQVPNVTIRDVTERAETIECGSNILSGGQAEDLLRAVRVVLASPSNWAPPAEYTTNHVSSIVSKIVLGYHHA